MGARCEQHVERALALQRVANLADHLIGDRTQYDVVASVFDQDARAVVDCVLLEQWGRNDDLAIDGGGDGVCCHG